MASEASARLWHLLSISECRRRVLAPALQKIQDGLETAAGPCLAPLRLLRCAACLSQSFLCRQKAVRREPVKKGLRCCSPCAHAMTEKCNPAAEDSKGTELACLSLLTDFRALPQAKLGNTRRKNPPFGHSLRKPTQVKLASSFV